jgi:gamma-glutamyltranspeptidase/glutathione hydrolase
MEHDPMFAPLFKDGHVLPLGERYYRPEFARTLELIARKGAKAFYEGEVAEGIVKAVRGWGGLMTLDDLKSERDCGSRQVCVMSTTPETMMSGSEDWKRS